MVALTDYDAPGSANMPETAASQYEVYSSKRNPYLARARACAQLTIPALFPEEGSTESTKFVSPWQSLGARGVNTLASKILLSMLPPGSSSFRMMADEKSLLELEATDEGVRVEIEEALSLYEMAVNRNIETENSRVPALEAFKQLIVAGNALLYKAPEGGMKVYKLNQYVLCRDPMGNTLEIITKETVAWVALPAPVQLQIPQDPKAKDPKNTLDIFTRILRTDDNWKMTQEIKGITVTEQTYPLDKSPWIPLRMIAVSGESYGRSYVEEYFGDLKTLDGLTQAIVEASVAGARVIPLVNPNGLTKISDLIGKPNGTPIPGRKDDVTFAQVDKYNDLNVARAMAAEIKEALSFAFLLNSSIQRNGERVTAEEIRTMVQELDDTLGGVYSILGQEFQLPFIKVTIAQMERSKKLPALPKGLVSPAIVTGIEALGRNHEAQKLDAVLSTLPPEIVSQWMEWPDIIKRKLTNYGINGKGLVKSEEKLAAEQKQAQLASVTATLGPNVVKGVGDVMKEQTKQQDPGNVPQA